MFKHVIEVQPQVKIIIRKKRATSCSSSLFFIQKCVLIENISYPQLNLIPRALASTILKCTA